MSALDGVLFDPIWSRSILLDAQSRLTGVVHPLPLTQDKAHRVTQVITANFPHKQISASRIQAAYTGFRTLLPRPDHCAEAGAVAIAGLADVILTFDPPRARTITVPIQGSAARRIGFEPIDEFLSGLYLQISSPDKVFVINTLSNLAGISRAETGATVESTMRTLLKRLRRQGLRGFVTRMQRELKTRTS